MEIIEKYNDIFKLSCELRDALEYIRDEKLYGKLTMFSHFPKECCTYTSMILVEYFRYCGIEMNRLKTVYANTKNWKISDCSGHSHSWVVVDDNVYVDITADQFNDKDYFRDYKGTIPCCLIVNRDTYIYSLFETPQMDYSFGFDSAIGSNKENLENILQMSIEYIANVN